MNVVQDEQDNQYGTQGKNQQTRPGRPRRDERTENVVDRGHAGEIAVMRHHCFYPVAIQTNGRRRPGENKRDDQPERGRAA